MKTINSRRARERKLIERIQKELSKAFRKFIWESPPQKENSFKDPVLPRKQ